MSTALDSGNFVLEVGVEGEDEDEHEAKSIDRGTIDIGVDVVARIDIPVGMLMPDTIENLEQLEEGVEEQHEALRHLEDREYESQQIMNITHFGMTPEAIEELISQRVMEALVAYEANHDVGLVVESQSQNGDDGDNRNGGGNGDRNGGGNGDGNGGGNGDRNGEGNGNGNGGGNGNGNPNRNGRGAMHVARECTYHDFVKCQPLNFKGTEGVVGLTRWFEKIETVVHINNSLEKYQVKFQELAMLCTKMVPEEEDRVKRFIGGLPDNIQGNVIAAEPMRLQDAIWITNNLMDQKLKGYAARSMENKR
ncbi:hypothetical protein Tco_0128642, partial [Tanacetum coccineum]